MGEDTGTDRRADRRGGGPCQVRAAHRDRATGEGRACIGPVCARHGCSPDTVPADGDCRQAGGPARANGTADGRSSRAWRPTRRRLRVSECARIPRLPLRLRCRPWTSPPPGRHLHGITRSTACAAGGAKSPDERPAVPLTAPTRRKRRSHLRPAGPRSSRFCRAAVAASRGARGRWPRSCLRHGHRRHARGAALKVFLRAVGHRSRRTTCPHPARPTTRGSRR